MAMDEMKGLMCYYSGSGNTKLACQYIAGNLTSVAFDLFNTMTEGDPLLNEYDFVGFATFTNFLSVPYLMEQFVRQLKGQSKPAFVFNTYGFISGKTLKRLEKLVTAQGFRVIAGHSLHTPESYPPMIVKGRGAENAPEEEEMEKFNRFISALDQMFSDIQAGKEVKGQKIKLGFLNSLMPAFSRTKARKDMGEKFVDKSLCIECGTCRKSCPYGAIKLDPKPVFDMENCYGCWSCYNHCPRKAIYTKKYRGVGHYPKPNELLREKLKTP